MYGQFIRERVRCALQTTIFARIDMANRLECTYSIFGLGTIFLADLLATYNMHDERNLPPTYSYEDR